MTSGVLAKPRVLITVGSGVIGKYLTSLLLSEGYTVAHLSRKQDQFGRVRVHRWDPEKGILNPAILENTDYIIHLAGAGIGQRRWSAKRKTEIVDSRIDSALLLHRTITANNIAIRAFISASGIGYYGSETTPVIFTEQDPPARDFLAETCRRWEEAADAFEKSGIRTVKIRTAVVLEKSDSAMHRLMIPARFGFLVKAGTGKQYMPWIHINDICGIYLKAVSDNSLSGVFNAVAPQHVTHNEFMKILGRTTGKSVLPPGVPSFLMQLFYGEMSGVVLKGSRVSSEKICRAGFSFTFSNLQDALSDLFK